MFSPLSHFLIFSFYIHDVTPSVVPSAVRIDIRICTIIFHVSLFIIPNF